MCSSGQDILYRNNHITFFVHKFYFKRKTKHLFIILLFFISLLDSVARIIIDDFVATPVTTTSAPVVFPLVDVDTFGVVFQLVSEFPDVGEKPVDATSTVSTTNLGGVPATVPEEGQTTNDDAEMAGGADMVVGIQNY